MTTRPLIITCAIVGAELTREVYPQLPLTPVELATAAAEAVHAGASIIHLHVRDEEGKPTQRVEIFQEVTEAIRNRCDCIVQYSTGGAVGTPLSRTLQPATSSAGYGHPVDGYHELRDGDLREHRTDHRGYLSRHPGRRHHAGTGDLRLRHARYR